MAISYPSSLDTLQNAGATETLGAAGGQGLAGMLNDHNDAIEALETKVGADTSAVTTSLDYKVTNTLSSNPGHTHTLEDGATDVTASVDELNILDGVTANKDEINLLDGITVLSGSNTGDQTIPVKNTASEMATGTDDTKFATALSTSIYAKDSLARQCIINGNFVINQAMYVSNAALSAGVYAHDRWKAGAGGGDYTFTQLASSTTITIKANKTLIQVIEDKNVIGGTYTLSWTGTAQARFGIDSATPSGAYAASPITITTQTAGTVMSVEFNAGTLGKVQLNSGSVALPFMEKSASEVLGDCLRYCYAQTVPSSGYLGSVFGPAGDTTHAYPVIEHPVPMRTAPYLIATAGDWVVGDLVSAVDVTAIAIIQTSIYRTLIECAVAGGLTQYRNYGLMADAGAPRTIILNADY